MSTKTRTVRIGNPRGIRIPKTLPDEAELPDDVQLCAEPGRLAVQTIRQPRTGWAAAASRMRARREDQLLDPPTATPFDRTEWKRRYRLRLMTARQERHISSRPMPHAGVRLARAALATALVTSSLHAGPIQPPRQSLPSHCAEQISAQRTTWRALAPPIAVPPATPDRVLRHWPTDTLGVWLVEDLGPADAVLARVGPDGITRVAWAADCAATTESRPRSAAPAPAFTDVDLAAVLAGGGRGVLYVWSPHMPLSVEGYAAVVEAAQTRRLAVDPLLDPAANRTFARTAAAAHGLPAAAMRVTDSVELQFRELALHAPSAAVYADGRLVGSVLRGYRTAEEYGAFFDRELSRR